MPSKTASAKEYSTTTIKGVEYFRTRITGVDGKRVTLYARTSEELAQKVQDAKHEIVEAKFRKENPTVAEYCQKWLLMQSAKVRTCIHNRLSKVWKWEIMTIVSAEETEIS